ncbi:CRTAC1 family protein [Celeribacter sp.]|uniref:CRTAC1 family protein n=1 Tax=Celeribacter sp. TaxID=1890673 RepID=UPI003A8F0AE7
MSRAPFLTTLTALGCLLTTTTAQADTAITYADRSDALPRHAYTGGWEHFVGGGVAVFDCNADGLADLFAAGGDSPARLMINSSERGGALSFRSGQISDITGVTGAYPIDIDSDGHLDLAVLRVGANMLLKGGPDCTFEDAGAAWGFDGGDRWTTAFSATWEAGADRPTLFFGNYVDRDNPDGPFEACDSNELHRPTVDGWDKAVLEPGFCTLSALMSKGARGATMLRLSNDRHYYVKGGYEQLYDLALDRFLTEEDGWDKVSLWGMGIAERDVDGDAIADVMLTSMGDQLLQFGMADGSYTAAPYDIGTYAQRPHVGEDGRASTGWHAAWGDVDNDADTDLFIAKGNVEQMPSNAARDPNNLLIQGEDGRFTERSVEAGVASLEKSRGAGLADLNGDGKLDLVVVNRGAPMQLYQNTTTDTGSYLDVSLYQAGANSSAVGSVIEVLTNRGLQTQEITIGGGHVSGQSVPLHFGLGKAEKVQVRVVWPDGEDSDWVEITPLNRWIELAR